MAQLLVSVRSAAEARAALLGGAAIVDVKEPRRGPLGRASVATWRAVRAAVDGQARLSVALGELADFDPAEFAPGDWDGIDLRKVGPAGLAARWRNHWDMLLARDEAGPAWVAVIYADWREADAAPPDMIIDAALSTGRCRGVLVDTWDKRGGPPPLGSDCWRELGDRVRESGRMLALAGRLDVDVIRRLAGLRPDYYAVRGAACCDGDRDGPIDPRRVAALVAATHLSPD